MSNMIPKIILFNYKDYNVVNKRRTVVCKTCGVKITDGGATTSNSTFEAAQRTAPVHSAKATSTWFRDHGIPVPNWPANSPDLNFIENLWGIVKRKMRCTRPNNAEELKATIRATWALITLEKCHRLIDSMPRRISSVIQAKGAPTRHTSNTIFKFAYDTTILGLITDGDETAYRDEVSALSEWCYHNNLSLNISKTKEMTVDYRKLQRGGQSSLNINGAEVERVSIVRLLGVHLTDDLSWSLQQSSEVCLSMPLLPAKAQEVWSAS
ncbi:hypothetical protein NFI96_008456 [Prochilodus magdalenae]|nr:hypothetical protein NFI96_008456 [Prochilodus magdalenae]